MFGSDSSWLIILFLAFFSNSIQKYMSCKGGCLASMGADQPAEVADDAPSNLVYLLFCIKILYCVYKKIIKKYTILHERWIKDLEFCTQTPLLLMRKASYNSMSSKHHLILELGPVITIFGRHYTIEECDIFPDFLFHCIC